MERTAEGLARVEAELRSEKVAALARIAGTLEGLLAEMQRRREDFGRHYPLPEPLPLNP